MMELFRGFEKSRKEALNKVVAVLDEEQKKQIAPLLQSRPLFPGFGPGFGPGPGPGPGFAPGQVLPPPLRNYLKLTKEQQEELDKLQKEVDARLKKLLTDEQRKMLDQMSGHGRPGFRPPPPPPPRPREKD